jgi:uncharacterized membrane-anchored protein YitT (DUF2179 family)
MGSALPSLLIILAMIGIIVAIGLGIAYVIKKSITGTVTRK